jgi:hypothetical protein
MIYLSFDLSEGDDGVSTLEAMASTPPGVQPAVMVEVDSVLAWAREQFPHSHGPVDEGHDWDHDLQVSVEGERWHVVTLTLSASPRFVEAFQAVFGAADP